MLTHEQKAQIRAEEIFRSEIAREIASKAPPKPWTSKVGELINSSFGIWFLSTVVVGLTVWAYTGWKEDQDEKVFQAQQANAAVREASFRLRQVGVAITNAQEAENACTSAATTEACQKFVEKARMLSVVLQLGGIFQPPLPQGEGLDSIWIGSSGYSYSHVPYRKGFQRSEYQSDELLDLARIANKAYPDLVALRTQHGELPMRALSKAAIFPDSVGSERNPSWEQSQVTKNWLSSAREQWENILASQYFAWLIK